MLDVGLKGREQTLVTASNSAKAMGSGMLEVFATPSMIALAEAACAGSIKRFLEPGTGSVGTMIQMEHTSATPLGMTVWCESELIAVEGRRLTFRVTAFDSAGEVGHGIHERVVVDNDRFMKKAIAKRS